MRALLVILLMLVVGCGPSVVVSGRVVQKNHKNGRVDYTFVFHGDCPVYTPVTIPERWSVTIMDGQGTQWELPTDRYDWERLKPGDYYTGEID